jgi:hypothetical protein
VVAITITGRPAVHAFGEQVGLGSAEHLPLDHLHEVDVALDRAAVPGHRQPGGDGVQVALQSDDERLQGRLVVAGDGGDPALQFVAASLAIMVANVWTCPASAARGRLAARMAWRRCRLAGSRLAGSLMIQPTTRRTEGGLVGDAGRRPSGSFARKRRR